MEPVVVYEDQHASIVYGHNSVTLGHLKIYPKPKVSALEDLPAKTIAHLFQLATRCASLLFDGLQAQGSNIILNDGKNANQHDDNICIDVIARSEKDGLSFVWQPKQGDINQVKQIASEISSKVIVHEKPVEIAVEKPKVDEKKVMVAEVKKEEPTKEKAQNPTPENKEEETLFDKKKNFLLYELMRLP